MNEDIKNDKKFTNFLTVDEQEQQQLMLDQPYAFQVKEVKQQLNQLCKNFHAQKKINKFLRSVKDSLSRRLVCIQRMLAYEHPYLLHPETSRAFYDKFIFQKPNFQSHKIENLYICASEIHSHFRQVLFSLGKTVTSICIAVADIDFQNCMKQYSLNCINKYPFPTLTFNHARILFNNKDELDRITHWIDRSGFFESILLSKNTFGFTEEEPPRELPCIKLQLSLDLKAFPHAVTQALERVHLKNWFVELHITMLSIAVIYDYYSILKTWQANLSYNTCCHICCLMPFQLPEKEMQFYRINVVGDDYNMSQFKWKNLYILQFDEPNSMFEFGKTPRQENTFEKEVFYSFASNPYINHRNVFTLEGIVKISDKLSFIIDNREQYSILSSKLSTLSREQQYCIALQICSACCYLHSQHIHKFNLQCNFLLLSDNLEDELCVKMLDPRFRYLKQVFFMRETQNLYQLQSTPPECLLTQTNSQTPVVYSDVFTFGVFLVELFSENHTFPWATFTIDELCSLKICKNEVVPLEILSFRNSQLKELICNCLHFIPEARPSMCNVQQRLQKIIEEET